MCWPTFFFLYIYILRRNWIKFLIWLLSDVFVSVCCLVQQLVTCFGFFFFKCNFWYFYEIAALWKCKLELQSFKPAEFHKSWAFVSTSSGKSFSLCVFFSLCQRYWGIRIFSLRQSANAQTQASAAHFKSWKSLVPHKNTLSDITKGWLSKKMKLYNLNIRFASLNFLSQINSK